MQLIDTKINANFVKRNTTYKWILSTEDLNWDKKINCIDIDVEV